MRCGRCDVCCASVPLLYYACVTQLLSFFLRYPNECQYDFMAEMKKSGGGMGGAPSTCAATATAGCNATTAAMFSTETEAFLKSQAALSGKGNWFIDVFIKWFIFTPFTNSTQH